MELILASSSPRRRGLLRKAGFAFRWRAAHIDESRRPGEAAEDYVRRMARDKALDVASSSPELSVVLGADTVVEIGGAVLGKPSSSEDAARMLRLLSGATHRVITGLCVARSPDLVEALTAEITRVTFRRLDDNEISAYLSSREPFDKAGAYGIQGLASKFVTSIEGCYFNVVGLPVSRVYELLKPFLK